MRTWALVSVVVAALSCLPEARAMPGERSKVMGNLYWCTTLCMCRAGTQVQVQCFDRIQLYSLLGLSEHQVMRMERQRQHWRLEDNVHWCNDLCLCHSKNNVEFGCVKEENLETFIGETVDRSLLYRERPSEEVVEIPREEVEEEVEEVEEEVQEVDEDEPKRRAEERKKNRRHKKNKKRVREEEEEPSAPLDLPSPREEAEEQEEEAAPTLPSVLDASPPSETQENEAELLPKQEAVAAGPAVTAMQPPTRRHPFPPTSPTSTHSSHASTREAEGPEISAVREVPVERKTVASEVSQDLDELGSAVLQIKEDVVLNQRILLVTVAVAGIAMLGVLILAVHSCARRRQMSAASKPPRDPAKDEHPVTKINREEEW